MAANGVLVSHGVTEMQLVDGIAEGMVGDELMAR